MPCGRSSRGTYIEHINIALYICMYTYIYSIEISHLDVSTLSLSLNSTQMPRGRRWRGTCIVATSARLRWWMSPGSLLQLCCSVLQCDAVCCGVLWCDHRSNQCPTLMMNIAWYLDCVLQCAAVCCIVLQRVAVCCGAIIVATSARPRWWISLGILMQVCWSVMQCVAVCCSVLQYDVAISGRPWWWK